MSSTTRFLHQMCRSTLFSMGAGVLLASLLAPVRAQQPASNTELTKQFREGFLRGCLQGKTPNVKNQPSYCNCMADRYQARYSGSTLAVITELATKSGENGPRLVNVMMSPEAKFCSTKS